MFLVYFLYFFLVFCAFSAIYKISFFKQFKDGYLIVLGFIGTIFVIYQIHESRVANQKNYAMTYFNDYLKMSIESERNINRKEVGFGDSVTWGREYVWYAAYSLSTAELLFQSFKGDKSWMASIDTIVCDHRQFVESDLFQYTYLPQYDEQFSDIFLRVRLSQYSKPQLERCVGHDY